MAEHEASAQIPWNETIADGSDDIVSAVGRLSSDVFEEGSIGPTDREIGIALTPRYSTFKKLEVVPARRINTMAGVFNIVSLVALAASSTVVLLARFAFSSFFNDIPGLEPGKFISVTVYTFPRGFTLIDSILSFAVFMVSLMLLLMFSLVLIRQGVDKLLNEQIWVFMLLVGSVLYLNPHEAIVRLRRDYLMQTVPSGDGFSYVDIFTCLRMASFSVISVLYLWMGSHSYRYLTGRISYRDWRFYAPKVIVVVIYNLYKLGVFFGFRITFSELPFATLLAFFSLYGSLGTWPGLGVITVSILTAVEVLILCLVAGDILRTSWVLRNAEYVKHRTKITGFRFFLHQQLIFYVVYVTTYLLLLFGLPNGLQLVEYVVRFQSGARDGRGSYFDVQYTPLGLHLCILAYVSTEAYTNLPASLSLRKFFLGSDVMPGEEEVKEPIVYRNREPPSFDGIDPDIRPNCFIMQTNIELFNLAWFVYYQGTQKEKKLNIDFNNLSLKIKDSFYCRETDTRVLLAASPDRIIVAFKGTSSSQNLFTDIKVMYRPLSSVVDWQSEESEEYTDDSRGATIVPRKEFQKAKIHAGFADAYNSVRNDLVSAITGVMEERRRPIFLTGHSLGGALATVCSIDISLSLDIPKKRVLVTTFGSPRVGNQFFNQIYDEVVSMHWRVVAGGDLISRLPKLGYHHVGKKVILTAGGELFIDPNALDMLFWDSQPASLVHHKKSCYLLALKAWCDGRDSNYVPNFWPFPISKNDSRKFGTSFRKPNSKNEISGVSRKSRRGRGTTRESRYKEWMAAIDTLDTPIQSDEALALWKRLATAVLEAVRRSDHEDFSLGGEGHPEED